MIAGLSKAATLYLTPVLTLTAILLSLFAYLAPVLLLHDRVSLLNVTPSTALLQNASHSAVDGPSAFLGVRAPAQKNDGSINCTTPTLNPTYDLSALPNSAPKLLLAAPTQATPVFLGIALAFSIIFFITFTLTSFRHKMGEKMSARLDNAIFQRLSAWLGFFGFMIGITSFLILRMWFGKAADDFNDSIILQGSDAPELIANVGNAFTMIWVAYSFYAVPLVISLSKFNVKASK
ncbi:hypothetical protein MSAN_02158300 [Mycena sanguinolenta]|uniref:Uncharacterized protein n=1 Tax=Mycena sanguinolenta TaxID=230812 RepID=A0A8H6XF80_9AGAR|nr:hypothetical protein MSAN_02158300 [Mycena sanguinolenta]